MALWIGLVVGIILLIILVIKLSKTNPREVAGIDVYCKKCGLETRGLECPKCRPQRFGV